MIKSQDVRVSSDDAYNALVSEGRQGLNGLRIGRPGRSRLYWALFPPAQFLRLRYRIRVYGRSHVKAGPAILVGNHLSLLDPVLVGLSNRFRVTFFTKVEVFEQIGAIFFRWTGQIPIRRGDETSTKWALEMAADSVARGSKLSIYPEGTRSADGVTLHRLHRRVLIPILQSNADVPVHAMTIAYGNRAFLRKNVEIRFSEKLEINLDESADQITRLITEAIISLGGMPYEHTFSRIHTQHREST
jgi:1-acyl-sn-glycerol-3-phosphate acyltransferase